MKYILFYIYKVKTATKRYSFQYEIIQWILLYRYTRILALYTCDLSAYNYIKLNLKYMIEEWNQFQAILS